MTIGEGWMEQGLNWAIETRAAPSALSLTAAEASLFLSVSQSSMQAPRLHIYGAPTVFTEWYDHPGSSNKVQSQGVVNRTEFQSACRVWPVLSTTRGKDVYPRATGQGPCVCGQESKPIALSRTPHCEKFRLLFCAWDKHHQVEVKVQEDVNCSYYFHRVSP